MLLGVGISVKSWTHGATGTANWLIMIMLVSDWLLSERQREVISD